MMEDDLFGSSRLFESFDDKKVQESKDKSSETETVSDSGEGLSSQEGASAVEIACDTEGQTNGSQDTPSESSLVILDETWSEEERASVEEVPKAETDSSEIEVLEDSESTTELSSDPVVEKSEQGVTGCQCKECPHLRSVEKLKRENEALRKQIQEMKLQHQTEILRLEKLVGTKSSDAEVITENQCETYSGFCIDKKGVESATPVEEETWKVPSYNKSFSDTLNSPEIVEEEDLNANRVKSVKSTCFNCLGDHMLNDCSEKKDQQRISRNRQDYMSRNGGKQARYHVENDLRFARFQPGRISEELRNALSLGRKELPFYIYKMRRLGYPPGWLKEAEISSSGISMYDVEEKGAVGENEDGEVEEAPTPKDSTQFDPKLLVGYPGYNVWLPQGIKDEWKRYGFPPIQDDHVKTFTALRHQAKKSKLSKRKRKGSGSHKTKRQRESLEDMDIEDCNYGTEGGDSFSQPPPPGVDSAESLIEVVRGTNGNHAAEAASDSTPDRIKSPTIEDLETAKLQLMTQLVDSDTPSVASSGSEPQTPSVARSSSEPQTPSSNGACPSTPVADDGKPGFSASKFVQLGSPSFFQASKGLRLPAPEKFAAGISEHIPFENLPDSVGKYNTMKEVLKKARRTRNSL